MIPLTNFRPIGAISAEADTLLSANRDGYVLWPRKADIVITPVASSDLCQFLTDAPQRAAVPGLKSVREGSAVPIRGFFLIWFPLLIAEDDRPNVRQSKTGRPVRFELTEVTRQALDDYLRINGRTPGQCLFPGRGGPDQHLTTRQYARLVGEWVSGIGLDPLKYATHSMRRTKATLIYRRTGNLRAVQLLLGHTKIDSTVRYLAVEIDDALDIAEKVEV